MYFFYPSFYNLCTRFLKKPCSTKAPQIIEPRSATITTIITINKNIYPSSIISTEISIVVNATLSSTKKKTQTRRTCSSLSAHPFRQQIRDALEIQYSSRGANLEARSRSIGGFRKCTATGVPNLCLVYFHLFVA